MANKYDLIIISDDEDKILGSYFKSCSDDLISFLVQKKLTQFPIKKNINHVLIYSSFQRIVNSIYVCYSHGNPNQLISKSTAYIDKHTAPSLKKTLFYTNACSSGKDLGLHLVANSKIDSFVGYTEEVKVVLNHIESCMTCDNFALILFIEHPSKTIKECIELSKKHYNKVIDKLLREDPLAAGYFVAAREALVLLGNENLTYNSIKLK